MKEKTITYLLNIALVIVILSAPSLGWKMHEIIFGWNKDSPAPTLALENEVLRAQLLKLQTGAAVRGENYATAFVFSRYPFNYKNEILIEVGNGAVVKKGAPVFAGSPSASLQWPGVLLGEVTEVYEGSALVRTIFDERWKSAVRIGGSGVEALLSGGITPRLTLISKSAKVVTGDIVYNADPRFEYGIPLGRVSVIELSHDQVSQESVLEVGYDANLLQSVAVERQR
jgi:cell shape-determining protein MreC